VLDAVSFDLYPAERVALTGPNGGGKTTLLHLIVGLLQPRSGEVIVFDQPRRSERDFRAVRRRVGLVFQNADDQLFCPSVLDDVMFGPLNLGLPPREARDRAHETLNALGLGGFGDRLIHRLSGGEKRLIALATVLAMRPDVLLLDEPTAGLDDRSRARLIEVLRSLPHAMLIATHDRGLLNELATRAVRLADGRLRHENRPSGGEPVE
jgi:cobalt/nickel transport system ATP-binding protein